MKHKTLLPILVILAMLFSSLPLPAPAQAAAPARLKAAPAQQTRPLTAELILEGADATGTLAQRYSPVAPVTIAFSQRMDPESARPALLLYPYAAGELVWNADFTRLTFTPVPALKDRQGYLVFLDRDLRSASGERFEQVQQWELRTRQGAGLEKPVETITKQTRFPTFTLTFRETMDAESVAQALSIQPAAGYTLEWPAQPSNQAGKKLIVRVAEALEPGVLYNFLIASSAHSQDGVPLSDEIAWAFNQWPLETSLTVPNSKDPYTLRVAFNYALDPSMEQLPILISPAVPGAWGMDLKDKSALLFNNPEGFRPGTLYTLQFTGPLRDVNGADLPAPPAQRFAVAPPVLASYPITGSQDECESIYLSFEKPVDKALTQAAFSLSPALPGSLTWEGDRRLIFRPDPFSGKQDITARLGTGAADAQGQRFLAEPYSWTFTCYNYAANYRWNWDVAFGDVGDPIQTLDADGRRAFQFRVRPEGKNTRVSVDFALFSLSREEFVKRYVAGQGNWFSDLPEQPVETWRMASLETGIYESLIPAQVKPGLYILRLERSGGGSERINPPDYLFIILTRTALLAKRGVGDAWVWASAINGEALAGAQIRIYAARGEVISQGNTDPDGLYRARVNPAYQPTLAILTTKDGELSVTGMDGHWDTGRCYYCWGPGLRAPETVKIYAYTERPIYKPGQTVYYKVVVRQDDDVRYSLPPVGTPLTVQVRDGRNNIAQTLSLQTNEFGTASGEFVLAEGAGLGDYALQVQTLSSQQYAGSFSVQDYSKPDFRIEVSSDKTGYSQGETAQLAINASYFFGAPLANTGLQIKIYNVYPYYDYYYYDTADQRPSARKENIWDSYPAATLNGRTGADGKAVVRWVVQSNDYYGNTWGSSLVKNLWGVEVTAIANGQPVSAHMLLTAYSASEEIRLERGGWLKQTGQPFELLANVRDLQGNPVAGRTLALDASRWDFTSRGYNRTLISLEATTDNQGQARLRLVPPEVGYYHIEVSGKDAAGHEMVVESGFYASKEKATSYPAYEQPLKIYAEQDSYQPYRPARFLIESQFSGPALLTIERGRVSRALPVTLTAPITTVDVPLVWSDAPNVFVTINAWQAQNTDLATYLAARSDEYYYGLYNLNDSELRQATVEIQVDASEKRLDVSLSADKERYQPRQQATFTIQVTGNTGKGVEAEVSLALVDEAIFSLASDPNPAIFEAFYGRRDHTVKDYNSFAPWRWLYDEGGRGGGGGDAGTITPRSDFPDTALWLPAVKTDKNGKALVTVTLPDNLTTWRLTARAVSAQTLVGDATLNFVTDQEVVLQPALPRSLTSGDTLELAAVVHNYSSQARPLVVALQAQGLEVTSPLSQTVELAAGEMRSLTWMVNAGEAGQAQLTFSARSADGAGDAISLPLRVQRRAAADNDIQSGSFEAALQTVLVMPEGALPGSQINLRLSPSYAGELLAGMEYLIGYPYGCVEQTMSRALPNVVVGRALRQLNLRNVTLEADLPALVNAGLQKLYGMQHNDGGWGWWYDDATDAYQTAWVTFGLALTAQAGYPVDPGVMERGASWLSSNKMDPRTQAFALYAMALAGHGDGGATLALAGQAQELDAFSQAALALALAQVGEPAAAGSLLDGLAANAAQVGPWVYWPNSVQDGEYHQKTMASTTRSTALVLSAFARLRPRDPKLAGIVRYLMSQRKGNGWGSTNETAFTLLALTDYLTASTNPAETRQVRVTLDGVEVYAGTLDAQTPSLELVLGPEQVPAGASLLEITQSGSSPLYYTLDSQVYRQLDPIPMAGPVQVTRRYLNPNSKQPLKQVEMGQLVLVELQVTLNQPGAFFLVEDRLPGGLEAINENLNTSSYQGQLCADCYYQEPFSWETLGYNNKEIRADRVTFFLTNIPAGKRTFTYLARALHSGSFSALPAEAYAMYDARQWGRSESSKITVSGP